MKLETQIQVVIIVHEKRWKRPSCQI